MDRVHGFNSHHIAEAAFKALARALRMAVESDPRQAKCDPVHQGRVMRRLC